MIIQFIIVIVALCLAGYFKGKLDTAADDGTKEKEWKNKWKLYDGKVIEDKYQNSWRYLKLHHPKYVEKFPYSSTALVWRTDTWHYYQFWMLKCFYIAISSALYFNIWFILLSTLFVMPVLVGIFFQISYKK